MAYTIPDFGPSDLMTSDIEGLRRVKVQSLNYRDDLVARGYGFYSNYDTVINSGAKQYLEFTTPSDRYWALNYRQITTDQERFFYNVYVNYTGITGASSIRIGNLKNDSSNASGSLYAETTGTPDLTNAVRVTHLPVFGSVGSGNRASGSLVGDSVFRLISPSSVFLLELDNQSSSAIYVALELIWAEIPQNLIIEGGFG